MYQAPHWLLYPARCAPTHKKLETGAAVTHLGVVLPRMRLLTSGTGASGSKFASAAAVKRGVVLIRSRRLAFAWPAAELPEEGSTTMSAAPDLARRRTSAGASESDLTPIRSTCVGSMAQSVATACAISAIFLRGPLRLAPLVSAPRLATLEDGADAWPAWGNSATDPTA